MIWLARSGGFWKFRIPKTMWVSILKSFNLDALVSDPQLFDGDSPFFVCMCKAMLTPSKRWGRGFESTKKVSLTSDWSISTHRTWQKHDCKPGPSCGYTLFDCTCISPRAWPGSECSENTQNAGPPKQDKVQGNHVESWMHKWFWIIVGFI